MPLRIPDRQVEASAGIRAGEQVGPTSGYIDFDCQEDGHVDP
jgi:hypothetical protein